jgi:hypothetical protein
LLLETPAFSTHLRQSNKSIYPQANVESAADGGLHGLLRAPDVTSIFRIRAHEYLELLRSTFSSSEARIADMSRSLLSSSAYAGISTTASFLATLAFIGLCLAICLYYLPADDDKEKITPRPLSSLYETNSCNGTWSRYYQNSGPQDKKALEMLFRCHIIAAEEFRNSTIHQPHIDECIWIGRRMLVERPLEDWLEKCTEAQQKFEESLNACTVEKWKVRSGFSAISLGSTKPMDFNLGLVPRNSTPERDDRFQQSSPSTPQQELFPKDGKDSSPRSPSFFSPEQAAILKSPRERQALLSRATEILSPTHLDRERRLAELAAMSDFDAASPPKMSLASSPKMSPPPSVDVLDTFQARATPAYIGLPVHHQAPQRLSSAPPGMYPITAREEAMAAAATSSDSLPSNFR